jgi:predicted dehydrogenase
MTIFPQPVLFLPDQGEPTLRWGVVGSGFIAGFFTRAAKRWTAQQIIACASRTTSGAHAFARGHGLEACETVDALLERADIDVIYVATPQSEHLDLGLRAIAAGKHVLIEKPLATTAADGRTLVDAARKAGVFLMEAMWSRYQPQTLVIRELLAEGVLGEVSAVLADFGQAIPTDPTHRLRRVDLGGGALLDLGIYPVQLTSMVFGAPRRIEAVGRIGETGVDLNATLVLDHGTADLSVLSTSIETLTPTTAAICGSAARLELNGPFHVARGFTLVSSEWSVPPRMWEDTSEIPFFEGLSWQANAFAKFVGEGRVESPLHTHDETVSILATIDEARRQLGAR